MAQLHRSVVTLRIMGDDLVPDEITRLLGVAPTRAQIKGEKPVDRTNPAKSGMWLLKAASRIPADMDGQIQEILNQTTNDLAVWQGLAKRYEIDLFCGLMMARSNEGISLSAQCISALGERGIEVGLDIYDKDLPQS